MTGTKLWMRNDVLGADPLWWLGGIAPSRGWTEVAEITYESAARACAGGTISAWEIQRIAVLVELALEA